MDDDIRYLLLTPGPLTTSRSVKDVMLQDHCTWDDEYNHLVSDIRQQLATLAGGNATAVLMQGSGTFAVEATLGSVTPPEGKVLVINNGAYGERMVQICERLRLPHRALRLPETVQVDPVQVHQQLDDDPSITHVAVVHCETTTGMLNPIDQVGKVVKGHQRRFIVDAMSSFGGIPMTLDSVSADFLISSANKCVQGVPGFGFVLARLGELERTKGWARSLSLDLFDQWIEMEKNHGKWRYTSPTHVVRAFAQALEELRDEGGIAARYARYRTNHERLIQGMERLGFKPLLPPELRSPIITSFLYPDDARFAFRPFYEALKRHRFVIYPGKVSQAETFRIGTIGHLFPSDIDQLISAMAQVMNELGIA